MNTYQTNIKTSILLMYLDPHHEQMYETPNKVVPSKLNKRGEVKRTNTGLPNTIYMKKLRKQSQHPIVQNSLLIYPHFGI